MKEIPILFGAPMVRAILDWKKTMTRRPVRHSRTCRFGEVGDFLWVRETWTSINGTIFYKERDPDIQNHFMFQGWRPSLFMPRNCARIRLEILNIEVQKVQELDDTAAQAEGFANRQEFRAYWDSMYAKKPEYLWKHNPDIWAISFKMLPKED